MFFLQGNLVFISFSNKWKNPNVMCFKAKNTNIILLKLITNLVY